MTGLVGYLLAWGLSGARRCDLFSGMLLNEAGEFAGLKERTAEMSTTTAGLTHLGSNSSLSQNIKDQAQALLDRFEKAEQGMVTLRGQNPAVFAKLAEFEAEKEECIEGLKRLLHTKNGPPAGIDLRGKKAIICHGATFDVTVVYPKAGDYYDPAALPEWFFKQPGVVTAVDSGVIAALPCSKELAERRNAALRQGQWRTPSVSIERRG